MKHLFIINPRAEQIAGRVDEIEDDIRSFFAGHPRLSYAIHKNRWQRDASGYVLRHVSASPEMVRVYALGGSGALFEVINGVVGLPNAQVAWYPLGRMNTLLYALGGEKHRDSLQSFRNLSLSPVITIDTIRAGNHYIALNALFGAEVEASIRGKALAARFHLPTDLCYLAAAICDVIFRRKYQRYHIDVDGREVAGEFISILLTNVPVYAIGLRPAPDAVFNDGRMDLYTIKPIPARKLLTVARDYIQGRYSRWPEYITHYRCKKAVITSAQVMCMVLDGNPFYDHSMSFEICPFSLNLVCPPEIKVPPCREDTDSGDLSSLLDDIRRNAPPSREARA
ncbi:MAG: hypothetical protein LBD09_02425 [Treponema sp.]|jgi:diacylglycerol kinase family enzyme|nr:hypothetical protein [Treponema sp.]